MSGMEDGRVGFEGSYVAFGVLTVACVELL